jgi:hypothetical protein
MGLFPTHAAPPPGPLEGDATAAHAQGADEASGLCALKIEYDRLFAREKRAEAFLDDASIPQERRERYVPQFERLLDGLNRLIAEIAAAGHDMTRDEIVNGFGTPGLESPGKEKRP